MEHSSGALWRPSRRRRPCGIEGLEARGPSEASCPKGAGSLLPAEGPEARNTSLFGHPHSSCYQQAAAPVGLQARLQGKHSRAATRATWHTATPAALDYHSPGLSQPWTIALKWKATLGLTRGAALQTAALACE